MTRANFTVVTKSGERWSANHLAVSRASRPYDLTTQQGGSYSILSFISSGELVRLEAADVERIEWCPVGAAWCSECDASIHDLVGDGPHANPVPVPTGELHYTGLRDLT